jgi:hypothetical protein
MSLAKFFLGLLCSFAISDNHTVGFGGLIQLRNLGTSAYLSTGPRDATAWDSPWDLFTTHGPFDENMYWGVNSYDIATVSTGRAVECSSLVRFTSSVRQTTLGLSDVVGSYKFVGVLGTIDTRLFWNLTCEDSNFWKEGTRVQLKNLREGCYMGTRLEHPENPHMPHRFALMCSLKSSIYTVWTVDSGLYPQGPPRADVGGFV